MGLGGREDLTKTIFFVISKCKQKSSRKIEDIKSL